MHQINQIPLFQELKDAQNILLAGAGGGFDIFCGLPLYMNLKESGKNVYLANYSFTALPVTTAEKVCPFCREVTYKDTKISGYNYFPEKYLSEWFLTQSEEVSIFAFEGTGVIPLKNAYDVLIKKLDLDAIILVDGGTDSLMQGDEHELGTPIEDSTSMSAVFQTEVAHKMLVCLGFGVDHYHGVSHYRFLESVARLIQEEGYYGCFSLNKTMKEYQQYKAALDFVNQRMEYNQSIVSNSIISAVDGHYGDYHRTDRTYGSKLWINPLMSIYWAFDLNKVIANLQYYDLIKETQSYIAVHRAIETYRYSINKKRPYKQIPI